MGIRPCRVRRFGRKYSDIAATIAVVAIDTKCRHRERAIPARLIHLTPGRNRHTREHVRVDHVLITPARATCNFERLLKLVVADIPMSGNRSTIQAGWAFTRVRKYLYCRQKLPAKSQSPEGPVGARSSTQDGAVKPSTVLPPRLQQPPSRTRLAGAGCLEARERKGILRRRDPARLLITNATASGMRTRRMPRCSVCSPVTRGRTHQGAAIGD